MMYCRAHRYKDNNMRKSTIYKKQNFKRKKVIKQKENYSTLSREEIF